jgi:AcrR family transcriptional regulator
MARPASDIAERVVTAARTRFLAEGVDGASLRAIARDAGTNLGMVYYYFPTKDALFLAAIEEVYSGLLDDFSRLLSRPGLSTASQLESIYARFGALSHEEVEVLRLIIREAVGSSARLGVLFERFSRGHILLFTTLLGQGQARGELLRDQSPLVLMMAVLSTAIIPQLMRHRILEAELPVSKLIPEPVRLAHTMSQFILRGIGLASGPGKDETPPR